MHTTVRLLFHRIHNSVEIFHTKISTIHDPSTLEEKLVHSINHKDISIKIYNNACFGAYLYSVGTQHGILRQSSVTRSTVNCFVVRANIIHGVIHN